MEITRTQVNVMACFSFIDYPLKKEKKKRSSPVKETLEVIKSIPKIGVEKSKPSIPF